MLRSQPLTWYTPEALVTHGFAQSRVVLMNEAHDGWRRSIRTRRIGQQVLPSAHAAGVRHFAMEALDDRRAQAGNASRQAPHAPQSYLAQPEMQTLVQTALDLGWTLHAYEADALAWLRERHGLDLDADCTPDALHTQIAPYQDELLSLAYTNWREEEQARRLTTILECLPAAAALLVWCGNGHLYKTQVDDWTPMGWQLTRVSGLEPFAIDQIVSVAFGGPQGSPWQQTATQYRDELQARGGTAGLLVHELDGVEHRLGVDAVVLSTDNAME